MEHVNGPTLAEVIRCEAPLATVRPRTIFTAFLSGFKAATSLSPFCQLLDDVQNGPQLGGALALEQLQDV